MKRGRKDATGAISAYKVCEGAEGVGGISCLVSFSEDCTNSWFITLKDRGTMTL